MDTGSNNTPLAQISTAIPSIRFTELVADPGRLFIKSGIPLHFCFLCCSSMPCFLCLAAYGFLLQLEQLYQCNLAFAAPKISSFSGYFHLWVFDRLFASEMKPFSLYLALKMRSAMVSDHENILSWSSFIVNMEKKLKLGVLHAHIHLGGEKSPP